MRGRKCLASTLSITILPVCITDAASLRGRILENSSMYPRLQSVPADWEPMCSREEV
jgi:hypothetical protein